MARRLPPLLDSKRSTPRADLGQGAPTRSSTWASWFASLGPRQAYELQPADGTRRLLYSNLEVGIGGHGTYNLADLGSPDERVVRLSGAVLSATLAFLDVHLRDDAAAEAWLASDHARILAGDADWVSR